MTKRKSEKKPDEIVRKRKEANKSNRSALVAQVDAELDKRIASTPSSSSKTSTSVERSKKKSKGQLSKKRKSAVLESDSEDELWSDRDIRRNSRDQSSSSEDSDISVSSDDDRGSGHQKPRLPPTPVQTVAKPVSISETKFTQMVFPKQGTHSFLKLVSIESCGQLDEEDSVAALVDVLL